MEEMLRADNITFSYTDDQHRAVDGLSLRVKRGEYVGRVGGERVRQIHAGQAF